MCIGIPMQVVDIQDLMAVCEDAERQRWQINLQLVDGVELGQWLLVFDGVARQLLTPEYAQQVILALKALQAVDDPHFDAADYFADLIDREPMLPEHLR